MVKTRCPQHTAADAQGDTLCPRCGAPLPFPDATDVLLETLTQLSQFGLDAEACTLLEPGDGDR